MGVIRSRGFVPSFSPFVSDPKFEPQCDPPRFTGARINLTYGRRSSAVVTISRLRAGRGSRGRDQSFVRPFKARGVGSRPEGWVQGQRGGAVVHLDLLGLINPSRLQN